MMQTIGLVAAMTSESNALLRQVRRWERTAIGRLHGYIFSISVNTCVLVTSGMGVRRASEATRTLLEMYSPHLLISFGIAGAVDTDLEIGDVVLAETVRKLDQGVLSPLKPLKPWPETARESAYKALSGRGVHLYNGTAVTTSGSQVMEYQLGEMRHPVLEMETSGIAQVAAEKGIPLLSLRAISDGPRAPIPFNLGEVMDEDANLLIGKLLKLIIRNPGLILQFQGMMRNTRLAADNAALALMAILSQAEFG